jgi:sortase A
VRGERVGAGTLARVGVIVLVVVAVWQLGEAAYIEAKARLAQHLIASAWERAQRQPRGAAPKPWPWADTWPVARLSAPAQGVTLYVLSDASGRSLAFGPGRLSGSAVPGHGNTVISAHRDTHFAFLERVVPGEEIVLELRDGSTLRYRVSETAVVHQANAGVAAETGDDRVTLLTCFPFRAVVPGGPLRYVVSARRI